jgi:hypothetical protein
MKSSDRQALEEQSRLVSRYVAGDLSRSERAEFEAWLVASPELASEVEMERRLRRGMASAARRGWLKRGTAAPIASARRIHVALAATVLIALAVGVSLEIPRDDVSTGRSARHASEHTLLAPRTVRLTSIRGANTSPDIIVSRAQPPAELVVEPEVVTLVCEDGMPNFECANGLAPQIPMYPEYEMELVKRGGGNIAWRSQPQVASARSTLSFSVPDPAGLDATDYDLIVRGRSPEHEEVVARYWLRINAQ